MKDYYTFDESNDIAQVGTPDIEKFLLSMPTTLGLVNVEDNKDFQLRDIDLVLLSTKHSKTKAVEIEVKVDTYYKTGNYFFETISNDSTMSEGCFMYSEADFLFYYFIDNKELHMLPLKKTREWFVKNSDSFVRKRCEEQTLL